MNEENCFLHSLWKMSDRNYSPVKEKLQDVEITPQNVTNGEFPSEIQVNEEEEYGSEGEKFCCWNSRS